MNWAYNYCLLCMLDSCYSVLLPGVVHASRRDSFFFALALIVYFAVHFSWTWFVFGVRCMACVCVYMCVHVYLCVQVVFYIFEMGRGVVFLLFARSMWKVLYVRWHFVFTWMSFSFEPFPFVNPFPLFSLSFSLSIPNFCSYHGCDRSTFHTSHNALCFVAITSRK